MAAVEAIDENVHARDIDILKFHNNLVKITDHDFGKVKEDWKNWLAKNNYKPEPVPLKERLYGL